MAWPYCQWKLHQTNPRKARQNPLRFCSSHEQTIFPECPQINLVSHVFRKVGSNWCKAFVVTFAFKSSSRNDSKDTLWKEMGFVLFILRVQKLFACSNPSCLQQKNEFLTWPTWQNVHSSYWCISRTWWYFNSRWILQMLNQIWRWLLEQIPNWFKWKWIDLSERTFCSSSCLEESSW